MENKMPRVSKSEKVPVELQPLYDSYVEILEPYCKSHLDEEYAQLARQAVAALCRKRPSPLLTGKANTWACGIIYALGQANFLFDKSETPNMSATDLCAAFGIAASTGSAKANQVRDLLRIGLADANWYRPSKLMDNSMAWWITVDGFPLDARTQTV